MPATTASPTSDLEAARALGAALRRLGYDQDAVFEQLGEDAFEAEADDVPLFLRRVPETRLGVALRLLFLEQPVGREEAEDALGERVLEALVATGAARVGDEVEPLMRILPVADLLVASDRLWAGGDDAPDYVSTYTPTAQLCDALTVRRDVARALDVGTGNGVQALLAALHVDHVVATDVNERALAFTALNAALNDLDNVECRLGSLFEPVAGETFDLITCNAPYVVSPEREFTYRDSGLRGDEVSARVVAGAAEHLAEGGFATLLVSWLADDDREPDARAVAWAEATGCSAWILSVDGREPLEHAAEWNAPLAGDPDAYGEALDRWASYFDELGAAWVTEGAVLLHADAGRAGVRIDEIDDDIEESGEQIERAFAARGRLERPRDLLDERPAVAMPLTVEIDVEPGGARSARVVLRDGMQQVVDATPAATEVVRGLDGREPLSAVLNRLRNEDRNGGFALAQELCELGALSFAG